MKKVLILSGSHPCHNPRVVKEADALSAAGMEVEVLGMNFLPHLIEEDRDLVRGRKWKYTAVPGPLDPGMGGKSFRYRLSRRMANLLAEKTGIQSAAQLGGWRKDLLKEALSSSADLAIAHSVSTLWVAKELMKRGRKVAVDFEDWFSREHVATPWHPDQVVARLEREVLTVASHATCTSEAMAAAIGQAYGRRPEVVYNAFPLAEAPEPVPEPGPEGPKVLWISQALGPGRGLELLAEALSRCEPKFTVTLVGNPQGNYAETFSSRIPPAWRGRVKLQKQLKDREVLKFIVKHHVGLALEQKNTVNHDVTVSNKILQYLLCGLAGAATDTAGQREIAAQAVGAVNLCGAKDSAGLAKILNGWAADPAVLQRARAEARKVAMKRFCWEKEKLCLARLVERSL
jgi:glycosyltransferase involved in cell wall biosynthesis